MATNVHLSRKAGLGGPTWCKALSHHLKEINKNLPVRVEWFLKCKKGTWQEEQTSVFSCTEYQPADSHSWACDCKLLGAWWTRVL